jgi:hypothetical protein
MNIFPVSHLRPIQVGPRTGQKKATGEQEGKQTSKKRHQAEQPRHQLIPTSLAIKLAEDG